MTFQEVINQTPCRVAFRDGWKGQYTAFAEGKVAYLAPYSPTGFKLRLPTGEIRESWQPSNFDMNATDWNVVE